MFSLESGLIVYGLFLLWREDFTFKLNKSEVINLLKVILPLSCLPMYIPQYILGPTNPRLEVLDLSVQHRMFIYAAVIIPILFSLKKDEKTKYFAMIFLSVATMITFSYRYSYQSVLEPWNLPLHLCNTAMYILPLSLIFRMKNILPLSYFINVFKIIAMLMPNYSASILMTNHQMITFWFNHSIAFFMPLLLVALGLFERPKLKQMYYSIFYFFPLFCLSVDFKCLVF